MTSQTPRTKWLNSITLVVVSTLMAELLSGSTPFSRITQLLPQFLLYGSGAVLVREITRRLGLGWKTIIGLGFAFGMILEGLVLQSLFNPHFLGLNIAYGRAWGVNWVWAEYMTGLHAFWSIAGAIWVTEVLYPKDRNERWVSLPWLWVFAGIFLLICLAFHFLFVKISGFNAPGVSLLCGALLAAIGIFASLRLPGERGAGRNGSVPRPAVSFWVIAFVTCVAGALWFAGIGLIFNPDKLSLWIAMPMGPIVFLIYFTLIGKWNWMAVRDNKDRLAVAAGVLGSDLLLGYTGTLSNQVDHYGQIGLMVLTLIVLAILFKRFSKSDNREPPVTA